jgi:hypothetical protein
LTINNNPAVIEEEECEMDDQLQEENNNMSAHFLGEEANPTPEGVGH